MLTSLFSALAFCGVTATLYLQKTQIENVEKHAETSQRSQEEHTRLTALTTAQNYYQFEIERMEQRLAAVLQTDDDYSTERAERLRAKIEQGKEKSSALMAELEELLNLSKRTTS